VLRAVAGTQMYAAWSLVESHGRKTISHPVRLPPDDLAAGHAAQPWYPDKTQPAFEDLLAKLRRALTAARFSATTLQRPDPHIIRDYQLACVAATA
jgi:hypothetical protein